MRNIGMGFLRASLARSGEVIQSLLRDLCECGEPRELLQRAVAEGMSLLGADRGAVYQLVEDRLEPLARVGVSDRWAAMVAKAPTNSPLWPQLAAGETVFANNPIDEIFVDAWREEGLACVLVVPLRRAGVAAGALSFYFDRPTRLSPAAISVARNLGNVAAQALPMPQDAQQAADPALLDVLFTGLPVALALLDARTLRILRTNSLAQQPPFHRYRLQTGRTLRECLAGRARLDLSLFERAASGEAVTQEFLALRQRRRTWHFHLLLRPIRGPGGTVERILVAGLDVTVPEARRRRLQAVLDMLPEAILITDARGRIVSVNRAMLDLPVDIAAAQPHLDRAMSGEAVRREPLSLRDLDLLVTALPVPNGGAVLSLADVTEMRRREALKDEFLSIASHELRTPLGTAKIYLTLAQDLLRHDDPAVERLRSVGEQLDRLGRMTHELLDVTRMERGGLRIHPRPRAVEEVVLSAVVNLEHLAAPRPVRLHLPERGQPLVCDIDAERIEQVLGNLITNASNHSPPDSTIHIGVARVEGGALVQVRDQGEGIPREMLPRLFDRYFTLRHGRNHNGLGLGLYISQQIVLGHGGAIWVESTPGQGTTVFFRLPLCEAVGQPA